jgi:CRISPR-associated protein Cas2
MISYDIKSDTRRQKIHTILKDYGRWMQYSVFECRLSDKECRALRQRLKPLIKEDEDDNIRFYSLCRDCHAQIDSLGATAPASERHERMIV